MTEEQKTPAQLVDEAIALYANGKYEEVITLCDNAIKLAPKHFVAFFARGLAKHTLEQREDAIKDFSKAIDNANKTNEKSTIFYYRGLSLFELGKYDEAETDYHEAVKLNPSNKTPYYAKFILSAAKELFPNPKNKNAFSDLVFSLHNLLDTVLEIKGKHLLKKEDDSCVEVTHFTKYETLKSMLPWTAPRPLEH